MSIFIFLLLLFASLMCCTNAAENRNRGEVVYRRSQKTNEIPVFRKKRASSYDGFETEQNPNDPKYKEMAKEIVYDHLRINKGDARKIIVNKVTTQVVTGTKTKIQFQVLLSSGKAISCDSETWEQAWEKDKKISYKCTDLKLNPENGHNGGNKQNHMQPKDVDKAKYRALAEESVRNYIENKLPGNHEIAEMNTKNNAFTLTLVRQQLIMYVNLDVIVRDSNNLLCSVVFVIPNTIPLNTKCTEKLNIPGRKQWADPSKKKYLDLANQSLFNGKGISLTLVQTRHDTIVTYVLRQAESGFKDYIDFIVRQVNGNEYECQSRVWEKSTGEQAVIEEVNCRLRENEPEDLKPPFNPDPPNKDEHEFIKYARESVRVYLEQKQLVVVKTNVKNSAYLTTLVHQQKILYVNLDIILRHSINYICTVVFVLPNTVPLNTECIQKRNEPDGNHWTDPSKYKYIELAEKSLEIKQSLIFASRHDTIITFVVQQVVSGYKYTIDFIVRLIDGPEYECHSHILENLTGQVVIEDIACYPRGSNPPKPQPNDPNAQVYSELGKAYIRIYLPAQLQIVETRILNIAYATPPVYQQQVIYINYEVVVRNSNNYICSVLFVIPNRNALSTKCIENQNTPGGPQWVDPSIPKYIDIAVESLKQNRTLVHEIGSSRYDTIITFVIQPIVSGYKDEIDFILRVLDGREYECHSLVWKKATRQVVTDVVTCHLRGSNPPEPKPNDLDPSYYEQKYSRLAIDLIKTYITQLPGISEIVETKIKNIAIVKTLVHQKTILYINYDIVVRPSSRYICSVLFEIPSSNSLSTKCIEDRGTAGGLYWVDPSKKQYIDLAEQWWALNKNGASRHDIIVIFVVEQVYSGYKDTIDFIVLSEGGNEYKCQSHVWKTMTGRVVLEDGKCDTQVIPGGQGGQEFDYSQYIQLGTSSILIYIGNLPGKLEIVRTSIINIAIVTTPVYQQKILYMNYEVVIRGSNTYTCSVLFELPSHNSFSTNCIENNNTPGGMQWVDPSKLKYFQIAVESLSQDKILLQEIGTNRYDTIVTFVIQQALSGYKIRIDFILRLINGRQYECRSNAWEKTTRRAIIEGVSCYPRGSNPPEPKPIDPNEEMYIESGKSHIRIYLPPQLEIIETKIINITHVTISQYQQKIMYINYEVVVRNSNNYICTVVYVIPNRDPLSTKCIENLNTPGGIQWVDPSKGTYLGFAEQSLAIIQKELAKLGASSYYTIVTFVFQQGISGVKDTIEFIIRASDGREYECRSNVWEKSTGQAIIEDVTCKQHGQGQLNPTDPLVIYEGYYESGKSSVQIYIDKLPQKQEIVDVKILNLGNITTSVHRQQILYINYDVTLRDSKYICTVVFLMPSQTSISTNCIENRATEGGFYWVDPSEKEYLDMAEKSLLLRQESTCVSEHDVIVTFVAQQVVSGRNDRIDFIVQPTYGQQYQCRSNVREKDIGQTIIDDLNCHWNQNQKTVLSAQPPTKPFGKELQSIKWTNYNGLAKPSVRNNRRSKKRRYRHRG